MRLMKKINGIIRLQFINDNFLKTKKARFFERTFFEKQFSISD